MSKGNLTIVPAKKPVGINNINLKISNNCFPISFAVSFKIGTYLFLIIPSI